MSIRSPIPTSVLSVLAASSAIGTFVAGALLLFAISASFVVSDFETRIYDMLVSRDAQGDPSDEIVIVDIDERSLAEIGQWSWPRYQVARIFDELTSLGAGAICADYIATDHDRTSPHVWREKVSSALGVSVDIKGIPSELDDFDEIFAASLRRSRAVMGVEMLTDQQLETGADFRTIQVIEVRDDGTPPLANFLDYGVGILRPIPTIADAAPYCGVMNALSSNDGFFRAMPAFLSYKGRVVPSHWLTALAVSRGASELVVEVAPDGPRTVSIGDLTFDIDHEGYLYAAFRPIDRPFARVSAADVYAGRVDRRDIEGKIAVFGASAMGLQDLRPTPVDPNATSVHLIASALDSAISGRAVRLPRDRAQKHLIEILAVSMICVLAFSCMPPRAALALSIALAAGSWMLREYMFVSMRIIDTPLFTFVTAFAQSAQAFAVRSHFDRKERQMIRSAFANYVSPEVVDRIVEAGGVESLEGETREISVLMTDIRGFTPMSERMSPRDVVALVNAYFTPMTKIVRDRHGTLDKYIGDALLAFWNAPIDVADHPLEALGALMEMRRTMRTLNVDLERKFGERLVIGGGLHTGAAHVGNMGTSEMISYTAIGDTVNTASRLESMCRTLGRGVVISEAAASRCGTRYRIVPLDIVRLKGKSDRMTIYTAYDEDEVRGRESEIDDWTEAFSLYRDGLFARAHTIASALAASHEHDVLYRRFADMTEALTKGAPPTRGGA